MSEQQIIPSDKVDVEKIMKEIREVVTAKIQRGIYTPEIEDALHIPLEIVAPDDNKGLNALDRDWRISYYQTLASSRPIVGPVIVFLKRIIRKGLKWLLMPLFDQISEFNKSVATSVQQIHDRLAALELNDQSGDVDLTTPTPTLNYLQFENEFRGSNEEISRRQTIYLDFFRGRQNVLDGGCGRGELLELLAQNSIEGYGVDFDLNMIRLCRKKGLSVIHDNLRHHLETVTDASLGGIFLGQVVEHLSPAELLRVIELSWRKLSQGAFLVIETVNPTSFSSFSNFYVDPTHVKPVHPGTLKYLFSSQGFSDVSILFSSPIPANLALQSIPSEAEDSALIRIFNENCAKLNTVLFGYQDYAVIGRKG